MPPALSGSLVVFYGDILKIGSLSFFQHLKFFMTIKKKLKSKIFNTDITRLNKKMISSIPYIHIRI